MRKALELLGQFDDNDIQWLIQQGKHRYVPEGSTFIEAGVPLTSMYILLDGKMQVVTGPKQTPVATLLAGEILGEISVVDPRPPQVGVYAMTAAHVLDVPRSAIDKRLAADREFAARFYFALAAYMAVRLRATTSRLGYGLAAEDSQADLIGDRELDDISRAAGHFNELLQRLRADVHSIPVA